MTGGSAARSGSIDVNPELIDMLIDHVTGGAGRFVADTLSTPIKAVNDEDIESYEIPWIRRVYGAQGRGTLTEDYYQNSDAIRITEKEARHFEEIGDRQALAELRRERRGEVSLIEIRRDVDSQMQRLRAARNRARNVGNQATVEQVERQMEQLMRRFNRLYYQRVEE